MNADTGFMCHVTAYFAWCIVVLKLERLLLEFPLIASTQKKKAIPLSLKSS